MEIQVDFVFVAISVSFIYQYEEFFIYKEYGTTVSETGFDLILSDQNLCVPFSFMLKEFTFHISIGNCCT